MAAQHIHPYPPLGGTSAGVSGGGTVAEGWKSSKFRSGASRFLSGSSFFSETVAGEGSQFRDTSREVSEAMLDDEGRGLHVGNGGVGAEF